MPEERKKKKMKRGLVLGAQYDDSYGDGNQRREYMNTITDPNYPFPLKRFQINAALKYIRWCEQSGTTIPQNWRLFKLKYKRNRGPTLGDLWREVQEEREAEEQKPVQADTHRISSEGKKDNTNFESIQSIYPQILIEMGGKYIDREKGVVYELREDTAIQQRKANISEMILLTGGGEKKTDSQSYIKEFYRKKIFISIINFLDSKGDDAESLAQLFDNDFIFYGSDTLQDRLMCIFEATQSEELMGLKGKVPGLHVGPPRLGDEGYKKIFQDNTLTQSGHFLTGLRLSLDSELISREKVSTPIDKVYEFGTIRNILEKEIPGVKNMSDEEIAIRLSIGHEKFPDPGIDAIRKGTFLFSSVAIEQFKKTTEEDIINFRQALNALGQDQQANFEAAEKYLSKIKIDESQKGNSYADLRLTLAAYDLGSRIKAGRISTRHDVALYIRLNLKRKQQNEKEYRI